MHGFPVECCSFLPSAFSGWKGFCKTKRERGWVGDVDVVEWIGWITMDGWNWITVDKSSLVEWNRMPIFGLNTVPGSSGIVPLSKWPTTLPDGWHVASQPPPTTSGVSEITSIQTPCMMGS